MQKIHYTGGVEGSWKEAY